MSSKERPPRKRKAEEDLDLEAQAAAGTQKQEAQMLSVPDAEEPIPPESPEEVLAKKNFLSDEEVDKLLHDVSQEHKPTLKDFEAVVEKANGVDDILAERLQKIGTTAIETLKGHDAKAFREYVAEKYPDLLKPESVANTPELDFLRRKEDRPVREKANVAETPKERTPSAALAEEPKDWGRVTPEIFERFVRTEKVPEVVKLRIAMKMIEHKQEMSPEEIQIYSAIPQEIETLIRNEQRDAKVPLQPKEELNTPPAIADLETRTEGPPQNLPGSADDLKNFEEGLRASVEEWREKKKGGSKIEDAHELNPESGSEPLPPPLEHLSKEAISKEQEQTEGALSEEQSEKLREMWGPWSMPGEGGTPKENRNKFLEVMGRVKERFSRHQEKVSESMQKDMPGPEHFVARPEGPPTTGSDEHIERSFEGKESFKMSERGEELKGCLNERSGKLEKEEAKFGSRVIEWGRTQIERYNKLNWKYKLAITGALMLGTSITTLGATSLIGLGGTALHGGAFANAAWAPLISKAVTAGLWGQRIVGGVGFGMNQRKKLDAKIAKNPEHWMANRSESAKNMYAATRALAYTGGTMAAVYGVLHYGPEMAHLAGEKYEEAKEMIGNMFGPSTSAPEVTQVAEPSDPNIGLEVFPKADLPLRELAENSLSKHLNSDEMSILNNHISSLNPRERSIFSQFVDEYQSKLNTNVDMGPAATEPVHPESIVPPQEPLQSQVQENLLQKFPEEQQNIIRNYAETLRNNVDTLPEAQQQEAYQRLDQTFSGNPSEVIEKINELPVDEKAQLLMGAREADLSHFTSGNHAGITEKLHEAIKDSLANGASIDDINKVDTQNLLGLTNDQMLDRMTPSARHSYLERIFDMRDNLGIPIEDLNKLRVADILGYDNGQMEHLSQVSESQSAAAAELAKSANIPVPENPVPLHELRSLAENSLRSDLNPTENAFLNDRIQHLSGDEKIFFNDYVKEASGQVPGPTPEAAVAPSAPEHVPSAPEAPVPPSAVETSPTDTSPVMPFERGPDGQPITEEQFLREHMKNPLETGAQGYHPPSEEKGFFERLFGGNQGEITPADVSALSSDPHIYTDTSGEHLFAYGGNPEERITMIAEYLTKNPDKIIFGPDDSGNYRIPWYLDNGNPMPGEPVRTSGFFGLLSSFMDAPKPEEFGKLVK